MTEEGVDWAEEQPSGEVRYDLKSAKEAAEMLRISESTVWRYAAQDILPSYRVGRKRVMFRPEDLNALLKGVRRKKEPLMAARKRLRMMAMSESADSGARMAMTRATALREDILARRGGIALAASWEDIAEAREERSRDL